MIENDNYRIKHLYTSMMVIEKLTVMTIIKGKQYSRNRI